MEQRRQTMLQLHLHYQQFNCILGHSHKKGLYYKAVSTKTKLSQHTFVWMFLFYLIQHHQFLTFWWQFRITSTNISNLTSNTGVKCFCQYRNKSISSFFMWVVKARIKSRSFVIPTHLCYSDITMSHFIIFFSRKQFAFHSMLEGYDFNFAHIIKLFLKCWIAYVLYMYFWAYKQNVANTSVCKFCAKWRHSAICMQKCLCVGTDKIENHSCGTDRCVLVLTFDSRQLLFSHRLSLLTWHENIDFI